MKILSRVLASSLLLATAAEAQQQSSLVLVHGAHFSASSWQAVQEELNGKITSFAIDLPGRDAAESAKSITLDSSAQVLCDYLSGIKGRKIIAAHSQGGGVVNQAMGLCPQQEIDKIIYVTSVAPANGDVIFDQLSKQDGENYFAGLSFNENNLRVELKNKGAFIDTFAPDATKAQKKALIKNFVAEPAVIAEGKLAYSPAKLEQIDTFYIFAQQDKIISLTSQKNIAAGLNLKASYNINSGHLPMLTKSEELADILYAISKQN